MSNIKYLPNPYTMLYLSDGSLIDKSGRGNNATNNGASIVNNGRFGDAFGFNGTSSYLSLPNNNDFKLTSPFTLICIVNPSDITNERVIFVSRVLATGGFVLYYQVGLIAAAIHNGGSQNNCNFSVTNNKFAFIAFTMRTSTVEVFYNGVTKSIPRTLTPVYSASNIVQIGKSDTGGSYYLGSNDAVILESRELSRSEILKLYQANFKPE